MQEIHGNLKAPNLFYVCVDARIRRDGSGRLYQGSEKEGYIFDNEYHLLKIMENLLEQNNFPQPSVQFRKFRETEKRRERVEKVARGENISQQKGTKGTFVVHVQYRQNATWQGEVLWVEKKDSQKFRSALELLKLMDNALDRTETNTEKGETV